DRQSRERCGGGRPDRRRPGLSAANTRPRRHGPGALVPQGCLRQAVVQFRQAGVRPVEARAVSRNHLWTPEVIAQIQAKADLGRYLIRSLGSFKPLPSLEDLTFIPCGLTRIPLEGYRERCETRTVIGDRFAAKPIVLSTPITIAGMSYGAINRNAKTALGRAATRVGISTTTGDGGMLMAEREASEQLVYEVLPSRYGFNPHHMRMANALEIVIGQGAKPGTGGVLLGQKVSEEIAAMRELPPGVEQRSPVRH